MGFVKAFSGALGGTFADQWKDFYGPRQGFQQQQLYFKQYHNVQMQVVVKTTKDLKILLQTVV